ECRGGSGPRIPVHLLFGPTRRDDTGKCFDVVADAVGQYGWPPFRHSREAGVDDSLALRCRDAERWSSFGEVAVVAQNGREVRGDITDVPRQAFDGRRWVGDVSQIRVQPRHCAPQRGRDLRRVKREVWPEHAATVPYLTCPRSLRRRMRSWDFLPSGPGRPTSWRSKSAHRFTTSGRAASASSTNSRSYSSPRGSRLR